MTDNKAEMGEFKNKLIWQILGWGCGLILTFLNLYNLPASFVSFHIFPKNIAKPLAYVTIVVIVLLLLWTCIEIYIGDRKVKIKHLGFEAKEEKIEEAEK